VFTSDYHFAPVFSESRPERVLAIDDHRRGSNTCCTRTVRFSRIAADREANRGHAPPAVSRTERCSYLLGTHPLMGYRRRSNSIDFAVLIGGQHANESSSDDAALAATADRIHPTRCQHRTTSTTGTSCPTPDLTVGTWPGHGTRQRRRRRDFLRPDGAAVYLPSAARDPELPTILVQPPATHRHPEHPTPDGRRRAVR
jgi:hypothetical protein